MPFSSLEYCQTHFPGLFCIKSWKISKFFVVLKPFFLSRISSNTFSWPIFLKKKRCKKFKVFDQNHGPTPLEKYQTFKFFNFVILECKNAFFLSRGQTHFPGLFCLKYNTPLEKSWFFDFFNFLFLIIVLKHFLLSRITSNTFCWLILWKIKTWKNCKFLTKTIV